MDDSRTERVGQDLGVLPPRVAPRAIRWLALLAMVGCAVGLARVGVYRISKMHPDFEYFYKAGACLLTHGTLDPGYDVINGQVEHRGKLPWYWPCVSRFMTLLAWLPYRPAGYVWVALNTLALLATVRLVGRHLTGLPPQDWPVTQLVPLAVLVVYWHWEFRLNQINNFTLLLLVFSFVCWQRGRALSSGFWLGLAVLLKLTPGLMVVWFILKRQYRVVAAAVVTVVLAGPVSDAVALGPERAVASYRVWLRDAVVDGSHRGLVLAQREVDWRNQAVGAVLSRWLHPTSYSTHFDNDPRHQARDGETTVRMMNVVSLSRSTVARIVLAVEALIALGLLWLARRPARRLTTWQLRFEWSLFLLGMLLLMPVMRRYHMIWALPALTMLGAGVHYSGMRSAWSKLALACIGAVVVAEFALLARSLEAAGSILVSVVLLVVPLAFMLMRLERAPTTLPEPYHGPPHGARLERGDVPRREGVARGLVADART